MEEDFNKEEEKENIDSQNTEQEKEKITVEDFDFESDSEVGTPVPEEDYDEGRELTEEEIKELLSNRPSFFKKTRPVWFVLIAVLAFIAVRLVILTIDDKIISQKDHTFTKDGFSITLTQRFTDFTQSSEAKDFMEQENAFLDLEYEDCGVYIYRYPSYGSSFGAAELFLQDMENTVKSKNVYTEYVLEDPFKGYLSYDFTSTDDEGKAVTLSAYEKVIVGSGYVWDIYIEFYYKNKDELLENAKKWCDSIVIPDTVAESDRGQMPKAPAVEYTFDNILSITVPSDFFKEVYKEDDVQILQLWNANIYSLISKSSLKYAHDIYFIDVEEPKAEDVLNQWKKTFTDAKSTLINDKTGYISVVKDGIGMMEFVLIDGETYCEGYFSCDEKFYEKYLPLFIEWYKSIKFTSVNK